MKIAFFLWNNKKFGCNLIALKYINALKKNGYEVGVYFLFHHNKGIEKFGSKSFFRLFFEAKNFDRMIFTGFWPLAYFSLFLVGPKKYYFIQAVDYKLSNNIILNYFAELSYKLPFNKIFVSNYLKKEIDPKSSSSFVLPNFVDDSFFGQKKLLKRKNNQLRILSVLSNYNYAKGPDLLEKTIFNLKKQTLNYCFVLASFKNESFSTCFDEFFSNISQNKLKEEYLKADIFINTSRSEGFFLPGLESMACGCPVILTDSGGVNEYAKNNFNCLLPKSYEEIVNKNLIDKVIKNKKLRDKLVLNGLETVKKFTLENSLKILIEILESKNPRTFRIFGFFS